MATKIQIRRDTAANWTSANPTLSSGELGYETDTDKVKVGDGTTAWTSLAYLIDPSSVVSNVVDDTTPQLGGNLDVNDKLIYNDTGAVKLQAGSASYVTIVNSSGTDKIRFSDIGGIAGLGWYHQFGDVLSTRGLVNIMGSAQGFDPGPGALKFFDGTSSASITLTAPTTLSGNLAFTLPGADGTNGQVMVTDGSGNLSFATPAPGGISNLVEDTTPQLGGTLQNNGNNIEITNGNLSMQAGANSGSIYGANVYLGNLLGTAGFLNIEGDGAGTAGRLTATGDITLNSLVYPSADGTNGQVLTTDGSGNLSFADASETTTTLTADSVNQRLVFTNETGTPANIDLSWAVDDTNLARITSGSVDGGTGIATFTRDDASTFTVDFSDLFDDTNLARITSGSVSGNNLTLTRNDATSVVVDVTSLAGGGISNVVEDTTPQLGGNLDVNDNLILNATGPVKLQAGTADYVTIVNSSNVDKIRFSDTGGMQALGWYHQFGDSSGDAGTVNIMGSTAGFVTGSGSLRIHDNDSSAYVELTVPTAVSVPITFTLPGSAGSNGQVMTTDGSGNLSFTTPSGGIANVVEDTTPQLGGNLDVNDNLILNATGPVKLQAGSADYVKIVNSSGDDKVRFSDQGGVQAYGTFHQFGDPSSGRGEVSIYGSTSGFFTGSGSLKIHDNDSSAYVELTVPTAVSVPITFTLPGADGSNGQVLTTDGSGNLSFTTPSGGISNLVEDTTPQLGGNLDLNGKYIGHANAYMKAYDFGTGSSFEVAMQGSTAFSIYANPGSSIANVTINDDLIVQGGDITLGGTGRIQGIDTVSANTDAANKLYVDNAVASAGGGISNVVEDTTPQLGGDLDLNGKAIRDSNIYFGDDLGNPPHSYFDSNGRLEIGADFAVPSGNIELGNGYYIGSSTANITPVDIGSGSIFNVDLQGSLAMQIYKDPFATPPSFTMYGGMNIRNGSDLTFQDTNDSTIGRHSTRGVTELVNRYGSSPSSVFLNVGSNGYENINWIYTALTSNVTLSVNGITGSSDPLESVNTISIMAKVGSTPYIVDTVQVDGVNQTINWAGGSAPTPTTNAYNLFTFTVFWSNPAADIEVFGSHQGF